MSITWIVAQLILSLSQPISAAEPEPFKPLPCQVGAVPAGEIEYVLTSYKASEQRHAVNQIGIRSVDGKLKFTARADLEDGYKIPEIDLEKGCALKKRILGFWKCIFEVKAVEKTDDKNQKTYKIITAETEFDFKPGECGLWRKGTQFNALQVTRTLSRRIALIPHPHPNVVPGVFDQKMP